jgi:hypothetical protein
VLDPMMPAAFQYIDKSHQIGIDIGLGVGQRISHPGLGGKIHHHFDGVSLKIASRSSACAISVR